LTIDFPFDPTPYLLGTFHCIIGIIAANLARQKGLNFKRWLLWGLIGGTATLVFAMFVPPSDRLD
jgi:uncharacterized membrane protein HdeD (DUF308 family)